VKGIIFFSGSQIVISCQFDDSLMYTAYLITIWINMNWSKNVTLIAFSKHMFYCSEAVHIVATDFLFASSFTK